MPLLRRALVRRTLVWVLLLTLLVPGLTAYATGAGTSFEWQCIADQRTVDKSGSVGFHILYHNTDNRKLSKAWVSVKVPDDLEVGDAAGGVWDEKTRTLKWNLKELDHGGADVIHFKLKVKADAKTDHFQLDCWGGVEGGASVELPGAPIQIGTEVDQPVFNGYPDGKFHPGSELTRAETAAIIARLSNLTDSGKTANYGDVPASHWAYDYVQKVTAAGFMNGYGGKFRPDDPITRGELVVLMLRVRGITPYPIDGFGDTKGSWAAAAAGTAYALRYFDGVGNRLAGLMAPIEREDAAKLISIMYARGELTDGETKVIAHWPDVPKGRWSFGWVEELSLVAHESSSQGPFEEKLVRYLPDQTEPL